MIRFVDEGRDVVFTCEETDPLPWEYRAIREQDPIASVASTDESPGFQIREIQV